MSPAKTKRLCVVRIGFDDFVLPMADGLKLVEIMASALRAERLHRSEGPKWAVRPDARREHVDLQLAHDGDFHFVGDASALPAPARNGRRKA